LEGEGGEAALFLSHQSEAERARSMIEIHCYNCGGLIGDREAIPVRNET
jgi:hypothetical protein